MGGKSLPYGFIFAVFFLIIGFGLQVTMKEFNHIVDPHTPVSCLAIQYGSNKVAVETMGEEFEVNLGAVRQEVTACCRQWDHWYQTGPGQVMNVWFNRPEKPTGL